MQPRLLENDRSATIPEHVFADLQLCNMLSADTIGILACPCSGETIVRRQELFSCLEDDSFAERVADLLALLKSFRKKYTLYEQSDIQIEKLFLYIGMLSLYADVCLSLCTFSDGGKLFSAVAAYYQAMKPRISDLQKALEKADALVKTLGTSLVSCSGKYWLTPDNAPKTVLEECCSYAQAMGLETPNRKSLRIHMDRTLSNGMETLYQNELAQIKAMFLPFADLSLTELQNYIPELAFYLEIRKLRCKAAENGIQSCLPSVSKQRQYIADRMYDISLLFKEQNTVVPNDVLFTEDEPFCFVTGANGGGKTTYLRSVGIGLVLFLGGCPVFAERAEIFPFSRLLTHFPADERFSDIGRLDEERLRTERMLSAADGNAFLLFNETYSGTDEERGYSLLTDTAKEIRSRCLFGLYVTHFYEVHRTGYPVLSPQIDRSDENRRTYRIVRVNGVSSSYAKDILRKYRLDEESLRERRPEI